MDLAELAVALAPPKVRRPPPWQPTLICNTAPVTNDGGGGGGGSGSGFPSNATFENGVRSGHGRVLIGYF